VVARSSTVPVVEKSSKMVVSVTASVAMSVVNWSSSGNTVLGSSTYSVAVAVGVEEKRDYLLWHISPSQLIPNV